MGIRRRGSLRSGLVGSLLFGGALAASVLVGIAGPASPVAGAATTFHIATTSLPEATPGKAYTAVTLKVADVGVSASPYTTTLRWGKISLVKGLKLSKAGVLFGTPSKRLAAGTSSIIVKVTEKVTTLKGKKKIRTNTTAEATIQLTIN